MKAIIPIKGLAQAKQRLSSLLSEAERRELMQHMIDDVLSTVVESDDIDGLVVISDDQEVRKQAQAYGARILSEPALSESNKLIFADENQIQTNLAETSFVQALPCASRLNQIFAMAVACLVEDGETDVLLLPVDVPLINTNNIRRLVNHHSRPGVTLVPASADGGTNALMISPPQLIAPGFGQQSSLRHGEFARAIGIEPEVLCLPELGLDVDTMDDLRELMAAPVSSATQRYLLDSDIQQRIEFLDQDDFNTPCIDHNGRQTG